jgi:hypothetical protein
VVPLAAHPGAPLDWSVDGRFLLYEDWEATPGSELFRLPLSRNRTPIRVDRTEFRETQGRLSPDGRWMAYVSNRSGKNEVNISPFTSGTGTWQVSTNGGIEPQWRGDGKELFYLAHDRNLMAVPLTIDATVQAGLPVRLFETQMRATFTNDYRNQYVASADGQRFLLDHRPRGESSSSSVTVVVNWMAALTNQ